MPINSVDRRNLWWGPANEVPPLFEAGHGGLQVFKIDVDAGITPTGLIEHDTLIERSVRIGDRLFAISSGTLSVHNLSDPTVQLGEINIGASAAMQPVELTMYRADTNNPHEQLLETPTYVPDDAHRSTRRRIKRWRYRGHRFKRRLGVTLPGALQAHSAGADGRVYETPCFAPF